MISISIATFPAIDDHSSISIFDRDFFFFNFLNFKFYTINWTASIATYNFA